MIFNLGSINVDYVYDLPHLPGPGETLAAKARSTGLGGKGANQSVAAALAGSDVVHIGAVGQDGAWATAMLRDYGANVDHIAQVDTPTGHAIVMVDAAGENQIVVFPGANQQQSETGIKHALFHAKPKDWLLLQNETSHQEMAAAIACDQGLKVAYSAAPFVIQQVKTLLPHTSLLILNEVEAAQFRTATGLSLQDLSVDHVVITKGRNGSEWLDIGAGQSTLIPAFPVDPVNSTGAGDTFAGYLVAGLDTGLTMQAALQQASAAAAISTTRHGTAEAIPDVSEVQAFLDQ